MKELQIYRIIHRADGTFSIVMVDQYPICLSVERPWLNNQIGISCIPTGQYLCRRVNSPKFGWTFEVTGVSGRTEILFHSGNIMDDSHGCIILGESFEPWKTGQLSIASSKVAFGQFMREMEKQDSFKLTIKGVVLS